MEVKSKRDRLFSVLCGCLVLMACCFRTAAVLKEDRPLPIDEEIRTFIYATTEPTEEPAETYIGETIKTDPSLVRIDNRSGQEISVEELLNMPLSLTVTEEPCVLILHTHGTEAYRDQEGYRSTDPEHNVIRIGKAIADRLNEAGIPTVHDTTAHDLTDGYDAAYEEAAVAIAAYLDKYPTIQVVIDVHRDAASDGQGGQKAISAQIEGEAAAGLLLVMGTHTSELPHENWRENLAFAMRLQAYLEEETVGLMRPTSLRAARYNEHFTPCSVLLEVGAAGNTMEEALCSGEYFGDALARLLWSLAKEP